MRYLESTLSRFTDRSLAHMGNSDRNNSPAGFASFALGAKRGESWTLLLILLLAFGLRLFHLSQQSFWWDEMWTAAISTLPLPELMEESFADRVHPPLYALAAHLWVRIGYSEFVLRYFSLIWGVLAIPTIYVIGRLVGGRRVGQLAAYLLAISPFHIWFSQEARMYSLVAALILAASYFLMLALRRNGNLQWIGYAVCMIVALYTHYLSLFVLLAHYGFFALHYRHAKRQFRKWLIFTTVAGVALALWIVPIALSGGFTSTAIGWIPPAGWSHPFFTFLSLSVGPTVDPTKFFGYVTLFLFLAGVVASFYKYGRRAQAVSLASWLQYRAILCWLLLPLLLVFVISLDLPLPNKRSIYMDRYLIVLLPALILLVAWGTMAVTRDRPRLLSIILLGTGLPIVASLYNQYFGAEYGRSDWRGSLALLAEEWRVDDRILITPEQSLPLLYYKDARFSYDIMWSSPVEMQDDMAAFRREIESQMATIASESDRVWLIRDYANNDPHGFSRARNAAVANVSERDSIKSWLDEAYEPAEDWSFTGIHVTLYDVSAFN